MDLFDEEGIRGELEVLLTMRLDVEHGPDTLNRGLGHPRRAGHGTATPMRAAIGRLDVEGLMDQRHHLLILDASRLTGPAFIVQALQALHGFR